MKLPVIIITSITLLICIYSWRQYTWEGRALSNYDDKEWTVIHRKYSEYSPSEPWTWFGPHVNRMLVAENKSCGMMDDMYVAYKQTLTIDSYYPPTMTIIAEEVSARASFPKHEKFKTIGNPYKFRIEQELEFWLYEGESDLLTFIKGNLNKGLEYKFGPSTWQLYTNEQIKVSESIRKITRQQIGKERKKKN